MNELTTLRLFSPLTANLYPYDDWGGFSDQLEELSPAELCAHENTILEQIAKEHLAGEGDRGLAVYLHDAALESKVYSMKPTVESWQGELWGVLEVKSQALQKGIMSRLHRLHLCGSDGETAPPQFRDGTLCIPD